MLLRQRNNHAPVKALQYEAATKFIFYRYVWVSKLMSIARNLVDNAITLTSVWFFVFFYVSFLAVFYSESVSEYQLQAQQIYFPKQSITVLL